MPAKLLLFDIGGVFIKLTGVDQMLEWTRGLHTEEDLWRLWLASPSVEAFETGRIDPQTFAREFVDEFSLPVGPDTFIDAFVSWTTEPYPGGKELMERLNGTYQTASLSNTNTLHWSNLCQRLDIESLFQHNFPSYRLNLMKPDPAIFEVVLDELGVAPEQTHFFDDSMANIDAAKALGIQAHQVFGVDHLTTTLKELEVL